MLTFATPAALLALGALAVPIALHLWSRRAGRPVRIGSVALFAAAPPPTTRSPRVDDPWLLALRCAVLVVLVLALAGPQWGGRPAGARGAAVWALVDAAVATDPAAAPLLDSLRAAGAELRPLGAGPVWSRLREADYAAPPGTRLVVVAPARGAAGERPVLRSVTEWLVPPGGPARDPAPDGTAAPPARRVVVYADAARRDDARYVAAAVQVAAEASRQPAVIRQRDQWAPGDTADWFVWLGARAVPDPLRARVRAGATLVTDAAGDAGADPVAVRLGSSVTANGPLVRPAAAAPEGAPLWQDETGRTLLAAAREGAGLWLRFGARFHPSGGDLVLHPAFPEAMVALWAGAGARLPDPLAQPIAVAQLLPARADHGTAPAPRRDLYHVFWLAGLLLFALERLAARRARAVAA